MAPTSAHLGAAAAALVGLALLVGGTGGAAAPGSTARSCPTGDPVVDRSTFVLVRRPIVGARLPSGGLVRGCSRTFESNVPWRLRNSRGRVIARGAATGGGAEGAAPFAFRPRYTVARRQLGTLEVFEEDASGGEGPPPVRNVIPVVLRPR